jgi:hypothetical protein
MASSRSTRAGGKLADYLVHGLELDLEALRQIRRQSTKSLLALVARR